MFNISKKVFRGVALPWLAGRKAICNVDGRTKWHFAVEKSHFKVTVFVMIALLTAVSTNSVKASENSIENLQSAYRLINNSDDEYQDNNGFWEEANGIANGDPSLGDSYWYFSQNTDPQQKIYISRVPYTEDLSGNFWRHKAKMTETIFYAGRNIRCEHVGDIDYHIHNGDGYIVAPVEQCDDDIARIYIYHSNEPFVSNPPTAPKPRVIVMLRRENGSTINDAPWVSVSNDGKLFMTMGSTREPRNLYWFDVNWSIIENAPSGSGTTIYPDYTGTFQFKSESGGQYDVVHRQGGDFSSDGKILYIFSSNRIHAFNTENWRLIRKSSKGVDPFNFDDDVCAGAETEGISYYDVSTIPNYSQNMPKGELYAMLLNNNGGDDQMYIRHYTDTIPITPGDLDLQIYDNWGTNNGAWTGAKYILHPGIYRLSRPIKATSIPYAYGSNRGISIRPSNDFKVTIIP